MKPKLVYYGCNGFRLEGTEITIEWRAPYTVSVSGEAKFAVEKLGDAKKYALMLFDQTKG